MTRQSSIFARRQDAVNSLRLGIIDSLAISAITGYQRYLSPHKGFRCAHRALHQGESCSQYVKREVQEEGLMAALRSSRVRFAECKEANQIIRARLLRTNHQKWRSLLWMRKNKPEATTLIPQIIAMVLIVLV
jgi:putative component of membrane protein insertase Oxa1/YidC/SpoIIIJ protein YidD